MLSHEQLNHLSQLAGMELDDLNAEELCHQVSDILQLVDSLKSVATQSVKPLAHPLEMTQRLREDTITEEDVQEELLSLAPLSDEQQQVYLVPKVIEKS